MALQWSDVDQNPLQPTAQSGDESLETTQARLSPGLVRESENCRLGTEGFEPLSTSADLASDLQQSPTPGAAKSGAVFADFIETDTDLQELIDAWPTLPAEVRGGIMAMARAGYERTK